MARSKAEDRSSEQQPPAPRRRGRPVTTGGLDVVLTLKGQPEWKRWLDALAESRGVTSAELIDEALALAVKRWKADPPPPRI